ncbi:TadE family type IV pilus minor pilin [Aeromicrobium sp.]|uniref:TadE family type IV pilus minor pilin n=1 Tax=Aeromicrobium sp. TaxID=1871063 RepID=UPI003C3511D8
MVTAEMAVLAPFGVAFGLLLLWIVSLGFTQVQLVDAARETARLVARGESVSAASGVARGHAPPGATVTVAEHDGLVTVRVSARSWLPLPILRHVGARTLTASAVSADETP